MHRFNRKTRVFTVLFSALFLAALIVSVAAADTKNLKGKVTFDAPAGYTVTEVAQDQSSAASIMNPSDPMANYTVSLVENVPGDLKLMTKDEAATTYSTTGSDFEMLEYKETTLGGKKAVLVEYKVTTQGMTLQNRQVMAISGKDIIMVTSVFMDMSKVADARKTAEAIEKSIAIQ